MGTCYIQFCRTESFLKMGIWNVASVVNTIITSIEKVFTAIRGKVASAMCTDLERCLTCNVRFETKSSEGRYLTQQLRHTLGQHPMLTFSLPTQLLANVQSYKQEVTTLAVGYSDWVAGCWLCSDPAPALASFWKITTQLFLCGCVYAFQNKNK